MLDQTLEDSDIDRLEDHFEVKNLILGHLLSFDGHVSFDWSCFGPILFLFRDVRFHLDSSNHFRCSMPSYSHIVRPLTSAFDFTYTHFFSVWA